MSLSYEKLKGRPVTFLGLFGVTVVQFEEIMKAFTPLWERQVLGAYKRPGRPFKLGIEEMVLIVLLYYRSYATHLFISFLFGVDDSRICRVMRKVEPVLAQVVSIPKERQLSQREIESLIMDATEQPIERPKKDDQKPYYSGKKKKHTVKTEIRITGESRIVHVSTTRPGAVHDFALYKQESPVPKKSRVYVDSGYQGLDKVHTQTELPYKASKNKPLDKEEKEYNRGLPSFRVRVENVLAQMKVFRILSDRYRNKRRRYNIKFQIIAGIVNIKNGFSHAWEKNIKTSLQLVICPL